MLFLNYISKYGKNAHLFFLQQLLKAFKWLRHSRIKQSSFIRHTR